MSSAHSFQRKQQTWPGKVLPAGFDIITHIHTHTRDAWMFQLSLGTLVKSGWASRQQARGKQAKKQKVKELLYCRKKDNHWLKTARIICPPYACLPACLPPRANA